ncbi:MAG TPA: hypothetical protein VFW96_03225 [Thermomicrobiales bacterium]|nr:hypothetical protein [Thermomicrobiales bacterium]
MTNPRTRSSTAEPNVMEVTALDALERATVAPPWAAELAVLRARLREVESALGLPLRPGQAVPPDLPALRRRVAAIERRVGLVPGLAPLPGCDGAAEPARATVITSEPEVRRAAWRARGRAALAAVAVIAALAWLLHPLPGGPGYFKAAGTTAQPATSTAGVPKAQPQLASDGYTPTGLDYREDHRLDPRPAPPAAPRGAGACRAGGVDCLPDDDLAGGNAPEPPAAAPGDDTARADLLRQCRFGDVFCLPNGDATGGDAPACHGGGCLTP